MLSTVMGSSAKGGPSRTRVLLALIAAILFIISVVMTLAGADPVLVFALAALTILPLAYFMGVATEELAKRLGPGSGGLLNATFGNATELIIAFFALRAGMHEIVKASITGSIIGNILLVLGLSMLTGGLRFKEQKFAKRAAGTSSTMLALAVVAMAIPTMMLYSPAEDAQQRLVDVSLWTSALLIFVYIAGLVFSLHTHKHIFNPVGQHEKPEWSQKFALMVLVGSTLLVAVESEFLVSAIEGSKDTLGMNELFLGVILIAIIGNAAEHGSAIIMAYKNKMDLSVGIATSSSTQIALFVAPILVFASWLMGETMTLAFGIFELAAIAFSVAIVHMVSSDGESNWYEGLMLLVVYAIMAVGFWFCG
jgi:Ca2+:H+ antiporter